MHKFVIILKETSINATQVLKFFSKSLSQVADKNDIVEVEVVKDPKITTDILSAFALHKLSYTISYTNDDPNEPISDLFDKRLKRKNIGKLMVGLQADNNGAINKDDPDELIQGGVMLAEQNGVINEAIITRAPGEKKIRLHNQNKPRIFSVIGNINTYTSMIISDVHKLFNI